MNFHLFSAKDLSVKLARNEIAAEQQAIYLIVSFLVFIVASYSGLVATSAAIWTLPSLLEFLALVAVTILGISHAFNSAGGRESNSFLVDFSCLYVPVSVTTVLTVWGVYWAIRFGFRELLVSMSESNFQFARNLWLIGSDFVGLITFAATVSIQAITYSRVSGHLRQIQSMRNPG